MIRAVGPSKHIYGRPNICDLNGESVGCRKMIMTSRVLIVDDNQPMRALIKMTLAGVAEVVGECEDGADALGCYEANRPDWVLMDWEMRTDGLTATRLIIKAYPEARILLVTQHDDAGLLDAAIEAGARGFVLKDDLLALSSFLEER